MHRPSFGDPVRMQKLEHGSIGFWVFAAEERRPCDLSDDECCGYASGVCRQMDVKEEVQVSSPSPQPLVYQQNGDSQSDQQSAKAKAMVAVHGRVKVELEPRLHSGLRRQLIGKVNRHSMPGTWRILTSTNLQTCQNQEPFVKLEPMQDELR